MKCSIDQCLNDAAPRSEAHICITCRQGFYYWRKKRPAEILERRRKLTMYRARLIFLAKEK